MKSPGRNWWRAGPLVLVAVLLAVLTGAGPATAAVITSDDFEDGNAAGWTTTGGTWIVNLDGPGTHVLRQSSLAANALARTGSPSWRNYTVTARVRPESFNGLPGFAGVVARAQSVTDYYALVLRPDDTATLTRTVGGTAQTLATATVSVDTDTWYTLSLSVNGRKLTGSVNGTTITAIDGYLYGGPAGLVTTWTTASFDDVVVTG